MSTSTVNGNGAAILARAIMPENGELPVEAATVLLKIRLDPADEARVNELATKAREGILTSEDRAELDEYERVAALLEILQSKARLALRGARGSRE